MSYSQLLLKLNHDVLGQEREEGGCLDWVKRRQFPPKTALYSLIMWKMNNVPGPLLGAQELYEYIRASTIKAHNWVACTTEINLLTVLEARTSRCRCWQGLFALRALMEGPISGLSPGLTACLLPLSVVVPLCIHTPSVSLCDRTSSSHKDTGQNGLVLNLMAWFYHLFKVPPTPTPVQSPSEVLGPKKKKTFFVVE